ncbi:unnamed protein product [Rhizoctonia solani]|uniref:Tail specific protease domain-containing protein n=1 Tax=Rhizoctonia solani TaxID=456999 RepID=A0A8H2ZYF5_9AGAM|nr:unnamed protein product [Rhizoctonia solani]
MPEPFEDATVDILGELQRIKQSTYSSDFELHQDVSRTVNRLEDGHAGYTNYCYDGLYITFLPFPLVVLAQPGNEDVQNIHIAPKASKIVMAAPARFQRDPITPQTHRIHRPAVFNSVEDNSNLDATLLEPLFPVGNVSGTGDMNWFVLGDGKTAVLRLGSFQGNLSALQQNVLDGIDAVKSAGASKLLIDVTNNGGGFVCLASWLHRVLAGPEPGIDLQPGMNSSVRAQQLPKKIVETVVGLNSTDLSGFMYSPSTWKDLNNKTFPPDYNWLSPSVEVQVNGVADAFSQRMGDDCLPFDLIPPKARPFEFENIAIMSNGRCGSSCSLFSILMHVRYKVKMVVVGGKPGTTQQYCGIVGGQALKFADINSELKSFDLTNDALAPPDFYTNSEQGIVLRLAYSPSDPSTFEEFKSHPAQYTFPLLPSTVNNLTALWEDAAGRLWST